MFRPLRHNGKQDAERRHMDPDAIDRVARKYAGALGLDRGYSAHSMRATFITTAQENGAQLEDVQKAAGHRDPSTRNYMIAGVTTQRKPQASSRRTKPT
jgi:integrase/recombinase XerD